MAPGLRRCPTEVTGPVAEEVAEVRGSLTGRYLAGILEQAAV